jgi:uncharacterized protein YdiU (UPF0061 family)
MHLLTSFERTLPAEASRTENDLSKILCAAEKPFWFTHCAVKETAVSDVIVRSIFESNFKDLKTKAFEYFVQIFNERYSKEEAEKVARSALALIEPLSRKQDAKVKQIIEELNR